MAVINTIHTSPSGTTKRLRYLLVAVSVLMFQCVLMFLSAHADNTETGNSPVFEETSLTVVVEKLGSVEIPSVISGQTAYLSIKPLFNYLKIRNELSASMDSITGYVSGDTDNYLIDLTNHTITYKNQVHTVDEFDLVKSRTHVFINIRHLQEIFGLECTFNISSLSVKLETRLELPVFRELRQEALRSSIRRIKGEFEADTTLQRTYPMLSLNTVDWAFYPQVTLGEKANMHSRIALGGYLAGGETTLGLYHSTDQPFLLNNQFYRWRYVNNNNPLLRQVSVGKIAVQPIATLYAPVIGLQVTNSLTGRRSWFGTYRIDETTEPNTVVELYVNNVLMDYVTADGSGHFKFDVPLSYGNTEIKLVYYGEWGEEKTSVKQLNIPYTFVPHKELEYTLSAGTPDDNKGATFYRGSVNYGLSRTITIGAGNEYLSSIGLSPVNDLDQKASKNIPFLTTSFSPLPGLLLNAEYNYRVRYKGSLAFRTAKNLMLELSYTRYQPNQKAIANNYREERKASIIKPFRLGHVSMFTRLAINQMVINNQLTISLTDLVLSANYKKATGSVHTYGTFVTKENPLVYSDVSVGYRLPASLSVTPSVRYDHTRNMLTGWKLKAEKQLAKQWFISVNYEAYTDYDIQNLQIGVRLSLKAANYAMYLNRHNSKVTINQAINGSLVYDKSTPRVLADNINKVGRGGLTIAAFLDVNSNGSRDPGEPTVEGLDVKVLSGGQPVTSEKDTVIRVFNLEAYTQAHIVVSGTRFKNIYWQLPKTTFSVAIDPNRMRLVEVPVIIAEE